MTSKIKGNEGIEFPDSTVQGSAAYTKAQSDAAFVASNIPHVYATRSAGGSLSADGTDPISGFTATGAAISGFTIEGSGSQFKPNVAGWYQVNAQCPISGSGAGASYYQIGIRVNAGAPYGRSTVSPYAATNGEPSVSALVYCNGTTDFIQMTMRCNTSGTIDSAVLSAVLVKKA